MVALVENVRYGIPSRSICRVPVAVCPVSSSAAGVLGPDVCRPVRIPGTFGCTAAAVAGCDPPESPRARRMPGVVGADSPGVALVDDAGPPGGGSTGSVGGVVVLAGV